MEGLGIVLLLVSPFVLVIVLTRRGMPRGGPDVGMHTSSVVAGAMVGGWALASAAGAGIYLALTYQPSSGGDIHSGCAWDGVFQFVAGVVCAAPLGVLIGWLALSRWSARVLLGVVALLAVASWIVVMLRPVVSEDCARLAYRSHAPAWQSPFREGG